MSEKFGTSVEGLLGRGSRWMKSSNALSRWRGGEQYCLTDRDWSISFGPGDYTDVIVDGVPREMRTHEVADDLAAEIILVAAQFKQFADCVPGWIIDESMGGHKAIIRAIWVVRRCEAYNTDNLPHGTTMPLFNDVIRVLRRVDWTDR
jgi:hypothetical protein